MSVEALNYKQKQADDLLLAGGHISCTLLNYRFHLKWIILTFWDINPQTKIQIIHF